MPTKTKAAPTMEEETVYEDLSVEPENELEVEDAYADLTEEEPEQESPEPEEQPAQLTGAELMAFYQAKLQEGKSHDEIAYLAGYYSVTKAGQERISGSRFADALLEAQGFPVGKKRSVTGGRGGRGHAGLTRARVSGSGILLVSQLATRCVGAEPGAMFMVEYPAEGQILLTLTADVKPVVRRKKGAEEEPGAPLLDQAA